MPALLMQSIFLLPLVAMFNCMLQNDHSKVGHMHEVMTELATSTLKTQNKEHCAFINQEKMARTWLIKDNRPHWKRKVSAAAPGNNASSSEGRCIATPVTNLSERVTFGTSDVFDAEFK